MGDSFYLASQYLRHHRLTTLVLLASITLILYLPAALQVIVTNAERHFRSRADSTPLIIGPRGSPLELVLGSVYFDKPYGRTMRMEQLKRVEEKKHSKAIPLHTKFAARKCQIVGTTHEYISERTLRMASGGAWKMMGECVVGAKAADRLNIRVGDKIPVSTSTAFLLDNPPLRLRVAGVLGPNETPDDDVIFVSLETVWIIEGLGHGHAHGATHGSPEAELYTDITAENVASFHFHGNRDKFPITSILVIPESEKTETILMGQYFSPEETAQIVRPREVMDGLLDRVIMVRSYMIAVIVVVSSVTILLMTTVIVLAVRLRRAEIVTMTKIGCSRFTIVSILGSQVVIILAASIAIAVTMTLATNAFGAELVRLLVY